MTEDQEKTQPQPEADPLRSVFTSNLPENGRLVSRPFSTILSVNLDRSLCWGYTAVLKRRQTPNVTADKAASAAAKIPVGVATGLAEAL